KYPPGHEPPGNVSYPRVHFKNGITQKRAHPSRQPTLILWRTGHVVQDSSTIRLRIEIVDEPEPKYDAKGLDAIFPADFLASVVGAAVIPNRDLVNAEIPL